MQISLLYTQQFFSSIVQQIFISPQWVVSKKKGNIDRKIEAGDNSEVLHADIQQTDQRKLRITMEFPFRVHFVRNSNIKAGFSPTS